MARFTLYVYADGSDLDAIAGPIERRTSQFIERTSWVCSTPRYVNQVHRGGQALRPGDLPDWDLGVNLDLPDPPSEPDSWFSDVERIVAFFASLRSSTVSARASHRS